MCAHNVCEDMGHCTWGGQGQCRNQFSPFTFTHVPGIKLRLPGGLAKPPLPSEPGLNCIF